MKALITVPLWAALTFITPLAAQEYACEPACQPSLERICYDQGSYWYVLLGGAGTPSGHGAGGVSFAFGRRIMEQGRGVDISLSTQGGEDFGSVSFPRIMYMHSFSPYHRQGVYAGAGLSWTYRSVSGKSFNGICAEGVVGYEFMRRGRIRSFFELGISQPAIPVSKSDRDMAFPVFSLGFGVGF